MFCRNLRVIDVSIQIFVTQISCPKGSYFFRESSARIHILHAQNMKVRDAILCLVYVAGSDLDSQFSKVVTSLKEASSGECEEFVATVSPRHTGMCHGEARRGWILRRDTNLVFSGGRFEIAASSANLNR